MLNMAEFDPISDQTKEERCAEKIIVPLVDMECMLNGLLKKKLITAQALK